MVSGENIDCRSFCDFSCLCGLSYCGPLKINNPHPTQLKILVCMTNLQKVFKGLELIQETKLRSCLTSPNVEMNWRHLRLPPIHSPHRTVVRPSNSPQQFLSCSWLSQQTTCLLIRCDQVLYICEKHLIQIFKMPIKVTLVSPRSKMTVKAKSTVSVTSEFEYLNLPPLKSPRNSKSAETSPR